MIDLDNLFQKIKKSPVKDREDAIAFRELYRELLRESAQKPEDFRMLLQRGEQHAGELIQSPSQAALTASANVCTECHKRFRNHSAK